MSDKPKMQLGDLLASEIMSLRPTSTLPSSAEILRKLSDQYNVPIWKLRREIENETAIAKVLRGLIGYSLPLKKSRGRPGNEDLSWEVWERIECRPLDPNTQKPRSIKAVCAEIAQEKHLSLSEDAFVESGGVDDLEAQVLRIEARYKAAKKRWGRYRIADFYGRRPQEAGKGEN